MRAFDYNSFADLSQVFDLRKGQLVPSQPKARVILYSTTALRAKLSQSQFLDVATLLPTIKPLFLTLSAKKSKPVLAVVADIAPTPAPVLVQAQTVEAPVEQPKTEEPKKVRTTLKLKTPREELVSLAPTIRRDSSQADFAAALRAEKLMMEKAEKKSALAETATTLESAFAKKRRHPLSNKPWSELLAEVDAPKQSRFHNSDLASLFKAEMKAFMAEQERIGETPAAVKFKSAAEHKTVSPQPQQAPARQQRPSMAA